MPVLASTSMLLASYYVVSVYALLRQHNTALPTQAALVPPAGNLANLITNGGEKTPSLDRPSKFSLSIQRVIASWLPVNSYPSNN